MHHQPDQPIQIKAAGDTKNMRFGAPRLAAAGPALSHRKISVPNREIIRPADGRHSPALTENDMGRFWVIASEPWN